MNLKLPSKLQNTWQQTLQLPGKGISAIQVVRGRTTLPAHNHLRRRFTWYDTWHNTKHHKKVHVATLVGYTIIMLLSFSIFQLAQAADLFDTWDFSSGTGIDLSDSALVEVSNGKVRLKAQNYASDANTMALYHFDENTGSTVADDSTGDPLSGVGSPSWATGNLNYALSFNGTDQLATAADSGSLSLTSNNTLESWVKFSSSFSAGSTAYRQTILDKGKYQLYYDNESGKITYELENTAGNDWVQQAGGDLLNGNGAKIKRSWDTNGKTAVHDQVKMGTKIYAGIGGSKNDAEVWEFDTGTSIWTQIAGDGINNSWNNAVIAVAYEDVWSLATDGTVLYAGLGSSAGDGDVWRYQSGSWSKIGGDGVGWAASTYETVAGLEVNGTTVYAGLGNNVAGEAEVWACTSCTTSPTWTKVGGDGVGSPVSWNTNYEMVTEMTLIGGNPVVGLGITAGDGEVWRCTASCTTASASWSKLGGDGSGVAPQSWASDREYVTGLSAIGNTLYVGLGNTGSDGQVWSCVVTSCTATSGWTLLGGSGNWGAGFEQVHDITNDGTVIYVGLGYTAGENEVWRYNGSWTKVGGDAVNSGFTNTHTHVESVLADSTTVYAGLTNASSRAEIWRCTSCTTSPTWGGVRIAGQFINKSWGQFNLQSIESMTTSGGRLYAGTGSGVAGNGMVWEFDGSYWYPIGGQGINSSWAVDTYESVPSMVNYKGKLYVGLGTGTNDAEVWRYDNPAWTKVADGSPAVGSAWGNTYETVQSLGVANDKLYAGLGNSADGDGEVWACTGCDGGSPSWGGALVGGDGTGWANTDFRTVSSMVTYKGKLYVGLGNTGNGDAEVWRFNNPGWTRVGGDAVNSSWANLTYEEVSTLAVYNDKLYAGLGTTASDAEVWACTGCESGSPSWGGTSMGGDSDGSDGKGWLNAVGYERVRALAVYNGDLYASLALTAGDGEVYKYDGSSWTAVGGDGVGWSNNIIESVGSLATYKGKLYAGMGDSANADAMVWSYGSNAYLQSTTSSEDTGWHHIAARYDSGSQTMQILRDGVVVGNATGVTAAMSNGPQQLRVGSSYGSPNASVDSGNLAGSLDEMRLSNISRSDGALTLKPYSNSAVTAGLGSAIRTGGVMSWESFTVTETAAGGSIEYRLSDNDGAGWKYWTGSVWGSSNALSDANTLAEINAHIATFPVTFGGIKWQAVLQGDGTQQVSLDDVQIASNADITPPSVNASALLMYRSNGGASVSSNAWTNGATPQFNWTAGVDAESSIKGYCLSLSQTSSDNPVTTKGILGTSPVTTGGNCQFIVATNSIDLATGGYLASPLTTSNSPYYLNVRAIDIAGNVFGSNAQFQFRFDNTAPTNPGFITAPSGFINTKSATLTWPTGGGSAAQDNNSLVAGLQYRINGGTWYGDAHSGTQNASDLLTNDGSYATVDPPDFDNLIEGINTFEFRTWDQAGNFTTSYVTAQLKINTNGAPSEPLNLTAVPSSNTTNAFAFNWDPPASYVGDVNNLTYCYTINSAPTLSNCSFTPPGVTSLGSAAYATQPGANTIYLVARDESSNINYSTFATAIFTANTTAPGIPLNMDIVDVSIKSTNNWRLALTWDPPSAVGSGIASYRIYRSTNNISFSYVGASTSTTYIDAGLSQQDYYYRVKACDSTNNCGADSSVVTLLPTGKFTSPANLTDEPDVDNITTRRARINWSTDRPSDSKIAIGTKSGEYSASEISNSSQITSHKIELSNLQAGTTYYYVARWTDEDGNTGSSGEKSFTTLPAPTVKEVIAVRISLNSATVQFITKQAVQAKVYFGQSEGFGGLKIVNTSAAESSYAAELTDLVDGTKYFYKVNSVDAEGNEYEGSVLSFTTPQRPKISNITLQPVESEPTSTQKVSWTTNVPTTSQIVYGKVGQGVSEISDSKLVTEHEVIIKDLDDNSEYSLVGQSRDGAGNLATSEKQVFKTALDTRPPKIRDVSIETTIRGVGSEARGQLVVTWKTDEPSTSQVAFGEGASAASFSSMSTEDANPVTEHIVIISDLSTAKVYNVQALSKDKANNQAKSESQSTIVGRASDSILSIIFNTLQKLFGFLGNN